MKKYISLILATISSFSLVGQADSLTIPAEQVEVVKRYEAAILQARKKKISYQGVEKKTTPISYSYNVTTEKVIDFERPDPEIRALSYSGDPARKEDLKDGYVYGAYGNYNTINAGAAYHYYIEDWLETGFKVDHFSSRDSTISSISEDPLKKLATTNIDAYLGYYLGEQTKLTLQGNSNFSNRTVSYFDTPLSIPLNQLGANLELSHNVFEEKGFALRVGGSYLRTSTDFVAISNQNENKYGAKLNILKSFSDKLSAEIPFSYQRYDSNNYAAVGDLQIEPTLRLQGQNYGLSAGVQYITGDDVSLIFPLINLKLESVVAGLDLTLSSEAEYSRNALSFLSEIHPYHNFILDNYSPSYNKSYALGLDYALNDLDFSLDFSYNEYENEANFQDFILPFMNFNHREAFVIKPQVAYQLTEEIELGLDFEYHFFLTDSINLYYKPQAKLDFHAKQRLFDSKLELQQLVSFIGSRDVGRRLESSSGVAFQESELPSFWDVSFKLNYRLSPSFDLFAKGTNLLGQDYVIWNPVYAHKQQYWAGIKFRL